MNDFLSLALDPFYGIERDCPSKVSHFFLKFRSLVYQKSLTSISSLEASKNVESLHKVRDIQETKNINARREFDLFSSLPESNDPNVKDPLADENGNSKPNEVTPLTHSKHQSFQEQDLKESVQEQRQSLGNPPLKSHLIHLKQLKDQWHFA
jgi:hypothetical protein